MNNIVLRGACTAIHNKANKIEVRLETEHTYDLALQLIIGITGYIKDTTDDELTDRIKTFMNIHINEITDYTIDYDELHALTLSPLYLKLITVLAPMFTELNLGVYDFFNQKNKI